jgi:putative Mn2+ efflux pump MntP
VANILVTSFFIAIGLAMDALAVSIGVGTGPQANEPRSRFRLAFHFGIFQGGMTLLGWLAGSTISRYISNLDHWLAFILLAYVGIGMIRNGFGKEEKRYTVDPSKGRMMVILSVATSIDAMAVGLSMAMIDTPVVIPSIVIAVVTFFLSFLGLFAGRKLGEIAGKRMEVVGGLILLFIGIRIVITHLFPG